jgi:hypothetical protein
MIVTLELDIDFDLLRKQKAMLEVIAPFTDIRDEVEGLLAFIDGIQDEAAMAMDPEMVYGVPA